LLVSRLAKIQEAFESGRVFGAFDESFVLEGFQVPETLREFDALDVLGEEEIGEVAHVLDELVVVEVTAGVELAEIAGVG
jgi:hypothetical protein